MPTITFTTHDADTGEPITHALPATYEVCDRCRGEGKHDHPAFANGITGEEWERDWDPDERAAYLSGRYSVTCEECNGERVVAVVDESACPPDLLAAYHDDADDDAHYRAMSAIERAMGA